MTIPLDDSQDPMPPQTVTVSDPVVTGDDTREAYSEGGLSGEATFNREEDQETEPFLLRHRSDDEVNEYDEGFHCGKTGGQNDDTKTQAWQRGWAEAQE